MSKTNFTKLFFKTLFIGIVFILLFLNYRVNMLQLVEENWFLNWQLNSEELVSFKLEQSLQNGIWNNCGFLGNVYTQQIGLQGIIFSILNKIFRFSDSHIYLSLFHSLNVLLLCILLFLFLYWVKREWGLYTAILSYFMLLINNWLIVSARNLYWVTFTFLLPFIFILMYYSNEEVGKRKLSERFLYVSIFVTTVLRCACGYEFISSFMVALEIPVIYFAIKNRWSWKKGIERFFKNGIATIVGFMFTLCMHFIQCFIYYGNITSAFHMLQYTIAKRTGLGNLEVEEVYWNSLDASKLSVINLYLFKGRPVICSLPMGILLCVYFSAVLLCLTDKKYSNTISNNRQKYFALSSSFLLSLFAPLSWYILASGHSFIHVSINYLLWSLPCILLGNILLFSVILALIKDHWNRNHLTMKIFFIMGLLLTIGFFYMDSCSKGISYMKNCKENGNHLVSIGTTDLYYYRHKVYVIAARNQSDDKYFYHIYPKDQAGADEFMIGFDNNDFYFKDKELKTPFWYDEKIAELTFKNSYLPEKLNIGQFNKNNRIWETTVHLPEKLPIPESIIAYNLSDSNWNSGIINDGTRILTVYQPEYSVLPGKYVETNSGEKILITDVETHAPYLHIILEKPIDFTNGYPYNLKISDK